MSVQTQINRILGNVENAYTAVSEKGGTLPSSQNSNNLATAIMSIPSGGGGSLTTLTATANGAYTPTGYDGYSSVTVAIPTYDGSIVISFSIAGVSYQGEEGMTWGEWVASDYNTGNFTVNITYITYNNLAHYFVASTSSNPVYPSDEIIANANYIIQGGGNN